MTTIRASSCVVLLAALTAIGCAPSGPRLTYETESAYDAGVDDLADGGSSAAGDDLGSTQEALSIGSSPGGLGGLGNSDTPSCYSCGSAWFACTAECDRRYNTTWDAIKTLFGASSYRPCMDRCNRAYDTCRGNCRE